MSNTIRIYRMRRRVHPLKHSGFERTYFEVVKVTDGLAECTTRSAANVLRTRGYEFVDEAPPKGALQPEAPVHTDVHPIVDEAEQASESAESPPAAAAEKPDDAPESAESEFNEQTEEDSAGTAQEDARMREVVSKHTRKKAPRKSSGTMRTTRTKRKKKT